MPAQPGDLAPGGGLQELVDIIPPASLPEPPVDPILAASIALAWAAAVAWLAWRRYHSTPHRARSGLRVLQRRHASGMITPRAGAFQLAALMRDALGLIHLSSAHFVYTEAAAQQRWVRFVVALSQARYSRTGCSFTELSQLIEEARFWLRQRIP